MGPLGVGTGGVGGGRAQVQCRRRVGGDCEFGERGFGQLGEAVEDDGADDGEPHDAQDGLHEPELLQLEAGQGYHDHREQEHAEAVRGETARGFGYQVPAKVVLGAYAEGAEVEREVGGPTGTSHRAVGPQG